MIVDLHTTVWTNPDQLGHDAAARLRTQQTHAGLPLDASPMAHEQAMSCVDRALVIGFRSRLMGADVPAEFIASLTSQAPGRRLGAAGVDPMEEGATDHVLIAASLGLSGIAVSPVGQGFHPAHSEALRVYECCADRGMPVIVCQPPIMTAECVLEFGRPSSWDEVARAFPGLPILIAGMGHPWIDETLVLLGKHENMYADISGVASRPWQLYTTLLQASSLGVMNKLMFGSGFPYDTPARVIETLYTLNSYSHGTHLPSIPRAQIRAIIERDSLACLGIEPDDASSRSQQAAPVTAAWPAAGRRHRLLHVGERR
jgi:hypothetical protein